MSDRPGDEPLPAPTPGEQGPNAAATDDDRDAVVARLRAAVGAGDLDLDELERRLDAAIAARTRQALLALTDDLPDRRPPVPPPVQRSQVVLPAFRNPSFQAHFVVWALVNAFLVGIWLLTSPGGFFWPFFPAAGWGIGLGAHYFAAHTYEAHKARRAVRRSERRPSLPEAPTADAAARSLHPGGSGPARRFVAAMFIDVVSSTELNETLGDQGWSRVLRHHRAMLVECFRDQGGTEVNAAGDGMLARFDHPTHAARAAVEILRRLDQQRETTGFAPSVRIGIHSGDVVDEGSDVVGSVVNLAARVTGAADPDEILVTEHVADHLPEQLSTVDRGVHTLKGVSRPRHLLALPWR